MLLQWIDFMQMSSNMVKVLIEVEETMIIESKLAYFQEVLGAVLVKEEEVKKVNKNKNNKK